MFDNPIKYYRDVVVVFVDHSSNRELFKKRQPDHTVPDLDPVLMGYI